MVEIGSPLELERIKVSEDYDLRRGEYYGSLHVMLLDPINYWSLGGDEGIARRVWEEIRRAGDEPRYVKVTSEWDWRLFRYVVRIEVHARHLSAKTPIAVVLALILAFIIALAVLISVVYFVFTGKPVEPIKLPEIPREYIPILLILLLIVLLARRGSR